MSTNPEAELQARPGMVPSCLSVAVKRSPILGYNHNVRYRGVVFHVQTEDSGQQNPHLFTHLFHEGVIVSTRKYVYDAGSNEDAIKGLMQAQHKAVMKDLRRGTFDDKIDAYLSGVPGLEPRAGADPNAAPPPRGERAPTEVSAPPEEVTAAATQPTAAPVIEITQDDLSQPIELPVKQRTKTAERTSKSAVKAPNEPPLPQIDDAPTHLDRSPIVRFQTPPPDARQHRARVEPDPRDDDRRRLATQSHGPRHERRVDAR